MDHLLESIMHVLRLFDFIIRPFVMEAQYRNTEFIHHIRIDLAVVVVIRHCLTTTGHTDVSAIETTVIFFQRGAVAACRFGYTIFGRILAIQVFNA
ncbi:hypothetical protein D3C86_2010820 [compost metagenome]